LNNPKLIREKYEETRDALVNKKTSLALIEDYKQRDELWRSEGIALDELRHQRKRLMPKGKPTSEQLESLKDTSEKIKVKQELVSELDKECQDLALSIPNVPDRSAPIGTSEDENVEVSKWGQLPDFKFVPKDHETLGVQLGMFDLKTAAKITGSRFVIYKNKGAKLERALINFMLDTHSKAGYEEILPPAIVHEDSMRGTGQLPKFAHDSFKIEETPYWLSPTAEVQVTNMERDNVIEEENLPRNYVAYAPCFRKEAGTYGKDIRGIFRQHQFNKVELVKFVTPETSMAELEKLTDHAETILRLLKLPYRKVSLCTGDLGFSAAKTYDLEVWFPSQEKYREISSCSNFLDFQARRALIRCRRTNNAQVEYLHTLNGSGLAVGRTFAAILENYQTNEGAIRVPDVLKSYLNLEIIKNEWE
jgi:seryl-tRNA synthetase